MINFSIRRALAIARKEFIKIKLDPTTLAMILFIPVLQIILFGYAIEFFPKHLPTAIINYDYSPFTRKLIQAIQSTNYFNIVDGNENEKSALKLLNNNKINFIITIPPKFTRDLIRGDHPHILIEADASSPGILGSTVSAIETLQKTVYNREFQGVLSYLNVPTLPFIVDQHPLYNANLESTHTIVPALIGVIIMLSLSLVTSTTIVDEKEAGNIEVLLNSRIQRLEIMVGKFLSYLFIGYIQLIAILYITTNLLFDVPMRGSFIVFLIVSLPFLMSNLMLGLAASALAVNQVQALQLVSFFFLPSFLLSGFLFPFYGMPYWAQIIGNLLPLTHYARMSSGIMLKNYGWTDIFPELWPVIVFVIIATALAIFSFKRTLD